MHAAVPLAQGVGPTREATPASAGMEVLRNGIDRVYDGQDNGVWCEAGATDLMYSWPSPRKLTGARLVFDSDMKFTSKRMLKLEAEHERRAMPEMLAKGFRIDARIGGEWKTVFEEKLNILRLRKVSFEPVEADALRLVVTETWGGDKAHVFGFDVL